MRKIKAFAIFNALSLIIQISVACLIQTRAINQFDVGEISARYETLFTPTGSAFSIWGIIYTALALSCLYYIIAAYKHDKNHPANSELLKLNGLFILVNLAGAAWMIVWAQALILASLLLIFLQLLCLIIINHRLNIYDPIKFSGLKITTQFPLSIYLGWISIAAIANTSSYLIATGWDGFGVSAIQWTVIMITIAAVISTLMIFMRRNIYFGLVVAWGLYGIIVKRQQADANLYSSIIIAAWAAIGIILLFSLVQLVRNISYKKAKEIFPAAAAPVK